MNNLLNIYNLESVADLLARTNPDGSKKVKLRKSYKAHIQDLPGKHLIPPPKELPIGLMDPLIPQHPDVIQEFDKNLLDKALHFDRTPITGIPGFDVADLALADALASNRGDEYFDEDGKRTKRKKKNQAGGDFKKQHV